MELRDKLRNMDQRLREALQRVEEADPGLASIEALAALGATRDALTAELRADLSRAERSGDTEVVWRIRDFLQRLEAR
jgi:hypothetical protein